MAGKREGSRGHAGHLRSDAEARLSMMPAYPAPVDPDELLHELRVHQAELEIQNEELRRSQLAVEESRDSFRDLYEFAPVGYLTLTDSGLMAQANLTAATLLGRDRSALKQRRFATMIALKDRDRFGRFFTIALRSVDRQTCEAAIERGDGSTCHVQIDCVRVGANVALGDPGMRNRGPALMIALTDLSERKQAEDEIRHLNKTLEASNQELESFSFSVSHDLRAPLRALNGLSHVLAEDHAHQLDDAGLDYLRRIWVASERMGNLVDDMIEIARISRQELRRTDVDMSALATRIVDGIRLEQPTRTVSWVVEANLVVRADPVLMPVLLENLLRNAWKFSSDRTDARIEFGLFATEGEKVFQVRDNGIGFDMSQAGRLFDPFFRLHDLERFEGSGIGLAIVKRIVGRHGGRIWAEGTPGKGATFRFSL